MIVTIWPLILTFRGRVLTILPLASVRTESRTTDKDRLGVTP
jgi:hypothetical protein